MINARLKLNHFAQLLQGYQKNQRWKQSFHKISISLNAETANHNLAGNQIDSLGTFIYEDGFAGSFAEVTFASRASTLTSCSTITAHAEDVRKSDYESVVGFYQVTDSSGSVIDSLTGAVINSGDTNYAATILGTADFGTKYSGLNANDDLTATSKITINNDSIITPYSAFDNNTYFSHGITNSESFDPFTTLGEDTIGLDFTVF